MTDRDAVGRSANPSMRLGTGPSRLGPQGPASAGRSGTPRPPAVTAPGPLAPRPCGP
jgi:hypothetical protein